MAMPDDAFDRARLRWEASREIAHLEDELFELRRVYDDVRRALESEIARWEQIAHPAEFRAAFEAAGEHTSRVYWNLFDAGVSSFEDAAAKSDDELLAIDGIDRATLGLIRLVIGQHAG